MPIFEYVCGDCKEQFEVLVRGNEKPVCPSCGKKSLAKQLSVPSAHVVGSAGPPCAAKESGECGASGCPSGGCGMANWG